MKKSRRLFALLLAVIMTVGVFPVAAFAASSGTEQAYKWVNTEKLPIKAEVKELTESQSTVVIAGSDFQDPKGNDQSAANVQAILNQIKKDYPKADGFIFCGDLSYNMLKKDSDVLASWNALNNVITGTYKDIEAVYVQGNHDQVSQGTDGLAGSGEHDPEDGSYGVFVIDEDDYQWASSGISQSEIKTTAANLRTYLQDKLDKKYDGPIFVASHLPLYFTVRTYNDGDGKYAKYIFDVLNEFGEKGLNIFFLHGHDHSQGFDNYVGGAAVYLPVGSNINIAKEGSQKQFTTEKLAYTDINAGYLGYYCDNEPSNEPNPGSGVDKSRTMTVYEITEDSVTISRYDENGPHAVLKGEGKATTKSSSKTAEAALKNSGYELKFTGSIESPQVVDLNQFEESGEVPDDPTPIDPPVTPTTFTDTATGITVTTIGESLSVDVKENTKEYNGIAKYNLYNIFVEGYEQGTDATVTIPVPADWTTSLVKAYWLNNGTPEVIENMTISEDGKTAAFNTNHFSEYMLGETAELQADDGGVTGIDWTKAKKVEIPGETIYTYTLDTNGIDSESYYIILAPTENNVAIVNNNGYGTQNLTPDNGVITTNTNAYDWLFTYKESSRYVENKVSLSFNSNGTKSLDNATDYYVLVDGTYRQVVSAECTRSGDSWRNRTYSWTVTYRRYGSTRTVSFNTQEISLYKYVEESGFTIKKGSNYISSAGQNEINVNTTEALWISTPQSTAGVYRLSNNGFYLRYNNGFALSNSTDSSYYQYRNLRLYKQDKPTTTVGETYWLAATPISYEFVVGEYKSQDALKTDLKKQIKLYRASSADGNGAKEIINYTLDGTCNPGTAGTYTLNVTDENGYSVPVTVKIVQKYVTGIAIKTDSADKKNEGEVYRGAKSTANTNSYITLTYNDGTHQDVMITPSMLTGDFDLETVGDYSNLTVNYKVGDTTFTATGYTLHVLPNPDENDYPEFPDQGSVRVNKTGKSIDWTSTGIAQIELSATGVPKKSGVDVIVMVDTSSSMKYGATDGTATADDGEQRIDYLRNSLRAMLEKFSEPLADGSAPDVRLALADFNGYRINSQHAVSDLNDDIYDGQNGDNKASVFTGPEAENGKARVSNYTNLSDILNADAFEQVGNYSKTQIDNLVKKVTAESGTNYDYAFDAVYRLATSIKEKNAEEGVSRELYVIFMSDGCPYEYNYYTGQSTKPGRNETTSVGTRWNDFLLGNYTASNVPGTYKYFYNAATGNTHRMADAIKGDPATTYQVISGATGVDTLKYSTPVVGNNSKYMYNVQGLGATMYSIGFCVYTDNAIQQSTIRKVIKSIASDDDHYFEVQGTEQDANVQQRLDNAFTQISQSIRLAATEARFVDTMGEDYDIQLATKDYEVVTKDENGKVIKTESKTITPTFEVKEYNIYKTSDVDKTIDGHKVTKDDIGKRYGEPKVLETITFKEVNGKIEAYSDLIDGGKTNILDEDGVIYGAKVIYNTNKRETEKSVKITTSIDKDFDLAPETFYWTIGNIGETDIALSYYVYLTGSMDGDCPEGYYPTNESAVLYYTNWLDHTHEDGDPEKDPIHKDTKTPIFPWGAARISFAFYYVDVDGNVITNSSTGATGGFADRIAIGDPQVWKEIYLNDAASMELIQLIAAGIQLPDGCTLFDDAAEFDIHITSDGNGDYWEITVGKDANGNPLKLTTYVTDYNGNEFTNKVDVNDPSYDYTHVTVWFAIKWDRGCYPDTVVIDYGLPVDINVLNNDLFGNYGSLQGIGERTAKPTGDVKKTASMNAGFKDKLNAVYGTATVDADKQVVHYVPKDMMMEGADEFSYSAQFKRTDSATGLPSLDNGFYYSDVTVIPATIIYYEDDFVSFANASDATDEHGTWTDAGTDIGGNQAEDRPGFSNPTDLDANNIYGYDEAYAACGTYSHGSAKKVTVSSKDTAYPTATFTFTGTGFDILSLTSNKTGAIAVDVYTGTEVNAANLYKAWAVDTFYGYTCKQDRYAKRTYTLDADLKTWHVVTEIVDEKGQDTTVGTDLHEGSSFVTYTPNYTWTADKSDDNALYQIPVIKGSGFAYGVYTVVITPSYAKFFDHTKTGSYDFYLDAIRTYNPAKGNETAEAAYEKDNEANAQFIELRPQIVGVGTIAPGDLVEGIAFVDGFGAEGTTSDYKNFGPNHEVYLAAGQAITFQIKGTSDNKLHLAAKTVAGNTAVTVTSIDASSGKNVLKEKFIPLETATDRYYDITDVVVWNKNTKLSNIITIENTGDGVLSLTNLKLTSKSKSAAGDEDSTAALVVSNEIAASAANAMFRSYLLANTTKVVTPEVPLIEDVPEIPVGPIVITPEEPIVPVVPEDPIVETFAPKTFEVALKKALVKVGDKVNVTITTSKEVASVTVNGETATLSKTDKKTGVKTWTYETKATEVGQLTLSVVAYNAAGLASEPITEVVTVMAKGKVKTVVDNVLGFVAQLFRM